MTTTLGWIFWTIGIVIIFYGLSLTWKPNDKNELKGWLLMPIGLVFNAMACVAEDKRAMFVVSIVVAFWDLAIYLKKKKDYKLKKINSKEDFLNSINKYKTKKV
jgi:hypothetical protein